MGLTIPVDTTGLVQKTGDDMTGKLTIDVSSGQPLALEADSAERTTFDPLVASGSGARAYILDTKNALAEGRLLSIRKAGGDMAFVDYAGIFFGGGYRKDNNNLNYTRVGTGTGTVYTLTTTPAKVDFGTTDPEILINIAGGHAITGFAMINFNGATYAANQTITLALRRTSAPAGDLVSTTLTMPIVTTETRTWMAVSFPVTPWNAALNDTIEIFASVSALPSAGSVQIVEAQIYDVRQF
jgi:hypothetical protein